jgi:hypothetical protein
MVSAWQADTKDTLPADTIDVFCSSVHGSHQILCPSQNSCGFFGPESMASNETLETTAQQLEASTQRVERSLMDKQQGASMKTGSSHDGDSDRESRSRDLEDSETTSDCSGRLKVAATAALAGISYDFGHLRL